MVESFLPILFTLMTQQKETQKAWYAVYTAPRGEKKVQERFQQSEIEHYLPLRSEVRQWHDRKKKVVVPVIRGYIFVHIDSKEFSAVLHTYGVVTFLREKGVPVSIPDYQMERFQRVVEGDEVPYEFTMETFEEGMPVEITEGSLVGVQGECVSMDGEAKILLKIEALGAAIVQVPVSLVRKLQ